ncbi:MAG: TfuA-like protein [Gammaproteobacteria bacterium]|nr:TfuA-like protein [Gammaproteobacteria bacterium]
MNDNQILIFLGPSLNIDEARGILPYAHYLPPVKCGDILHSIRLKPRAVVIIDGLYERTAAVWHKEILFAMEQGILVVGAASMGALRAAELHAYNMIGLGKIFLDYKNVLISDDDEVAILHAPDNLGYANLTEAMVNIRATLKKAEVDGLMSLMDSKIICEAAKSLFYQERTFKKAIEVAINNGLDNQMADRFQDWLKKDNYVDQKRLDAIEALKFIKNIDLDSLIAETTPPSIFFRALNRKVSCQSFPYFTNSLPITEKAGIASKLVINFSLIQRLAYLFSTAYMLALSMKLEPASKLPFGINEDDFNEQWQKLNDYSEVEGHELSNRLQCVHSLINLVPDNSEQFMAYLKWLHCETPGITEEEFYHGLPDKELKLYKIIATLWSTIDFIATEKSLNPNANEIQKFSEKFRLKRGLVTMDSFNNWLEQQHVSIQEYRDFINVLVRFDYLIVRNNIDCLIDKMVNENYWWLIDSLRISGFYVKSKLLLSNENEIKTSLGTLRDKIHKDGESFIYSSGFIDYEDFERFANSVISSYKPI